MVHWTELKVFSFYSHHTDILLQGFLDLKDKTQLHFKTVHAIRLRCDEKHSCGIEVTEDRPSILKEIVEFANSSEHVNIITSLYFMLLYTGTEDQKTSDQ
jgi:uncharacterized protein YqfB (UPF0267 family)